MGNIESKVIPVNEVPMEVAEDPRSMAAFVNDHIIGDPRKDSAPKGVTLPPHVAAIDAQLAKQIPPEGIRRTK